MSTIVSGALLPPRIERPAPKAAALPVAPLRAKQTDAMGHSARAKFKREVRVQRREQAGDKEQERKSAVQLALERAAAAPKVSVKNVRREDAADAKRDNRRDGREVPMDKATLAAVEEARQQAMASAKWGITAPALLQTKKGKVTKKVASTGARLAASFQNDSKARKGQKKIFKQVAARGVAKKTTRRK